VDVQIRSFLAAAILTIIGAAPAAAQAVRGQLVDRRNGRPITGGFVVLLNDQEQEIARVLTDTQGRFFLRAPAPGTYQLQSKRIGFRLTTSPAFELAQDQTVGQRLEVDEVPASLPPVIVEGKPQCGTRGERGTAVAQLWEDAREALAAVSWTTGQRAHSFTMQRFDRTFPPVGGRVLKEERSTHSSYSDMPWRSMPAEELARRGYIVGDFRDTLTYSAPDANVLLSDVFVNTHCFSARDGGAEHPGLVGLAFEPVPGRKLPDVSGVLWVDRATQELRSADFQYTTLPAFLPEGPIGGRLEFMRLPTGVWIVKHWRIRMAQVGRVVYRDTGREGDYRVTGFREQGGQVLSIATLRGSVVYSAQRAILEGTVFDSTRRAGLPRAEVYLVGTSQSVHADERGMFQMVASLDGEYGVAFRHPRLDSLGYTPSPVTAALRSGERTVVTVGIPPEHRLVLRLCPDSTLEETDRVLVGRVRDDGGRAVPGATVRVAWQTVGGTQGRPQATDWAEVATADSGGRFVVCGVPPVLLTVSARGEAGSSSPAILRFTEDGVWIGNRYRSFPNRIWTQEITLR
jgi:hypothetical protein